MQSDEKVNDSSIHANARKRIIALEGNMSSGKSTLAKAAKSDKIKVLLEDAPESLLQKFYANPKRYAITLQLFMMTSRVDAMVHMRFRLESGCTGILDRSIFGDIVFAMKQVLDDNMDRDEWLIYCEIAKKKKWTEWLRELEIVYLHTQPSRCRESIKERGHVDQNVKQDYLDDIDSVHIYSLILMHHLLGVHATIVDWHMFGTPDDLWKHLAKRANFNSSSVTSTIATNDESKKSVTVPIRDGVLHGIAQEYRFVHTQTWKDQTMKRMAQGIVPSFEEMDATPSMWHVVAKLWLDMMKI